MTFSSLPHSASSRIAVVSHTHPSLSKGGAEIAAYTLVKALRAVGVKAAFIAACDRERQDELILEDDHEFTVFYDRRRYDPFYQIGAPELWPQLRSILERERIELVNFHHFLNFGLNTIRSLPGETQIRSVLTLHEFNAICANHGQMVTHPGRTLCEEATPKSCRACFPERTIQQFSVRRDLVLSTFAAMAGFISPSAFLAGRFAEWGLPPDRLAVIENGLPLVRASPKRRAHADGAPWVFGFFGQINPFKGVDTLLRAVEALGQSDVRPEMIRIRIHGNIIGQSEEFTQRFAALVEKHSFLSHMGPYNNASVGRLMGECDYVLVPSNWWENSPVVIQEAYAAKRPVICSGIGGMAEKVIDGVSGLHFRVGDHFDLVRVLRQAMNDALYAKLEAGLPQVRTAEEMALEYLQAFDRFCAATNPVKPRSAKHGTSTKNRLRRIQPAP